MGILDDLAMGFGFKEKDRDYYERTAATIAKNQGSDASDSYKKYVGMTGGSVSKTNPLGIMSGSSYANAPNYFQKIGPSLSDFRPVPTTGANSDPYDSSGNLQPDYKPGTAAQRYRDVGRPQPGTLPHMLTRSPGILGLLANILGGYKPIAPQTELPSTYRPQRVAPATPTAPALGAQTPPVQTSPMIGYGFEEDKFGFNPQTPRATLNELDIDTNPGYSQVADGQYVPSYNPFEATTAAQAQLTPDVLMFPKEAIGQFGQVVLNPSAASGVTLEQWLQTEQGSRYNNPDLPEDFVRRAFETAKRLNAGKF